MAHVKTTNWVLDGQIETFPLMYHYRVIPFSGKRAEVDHERHKRYVEYWGGNENIGRYILDRSSANMSWFCSWSMYPTSCGRGCRKTLAGSTRFWTTCALPSTSCGRTRLSILTRISAICSPTASGHT